MFLVPRWCWPADLSSSAAIRPNFSIVKWVRLKKNFTFWWVLNESIWITKLGKYMYKLPFAFVLTSCIELKLWRKGRCQTCRNPLYCITTQSIRILKQPVLDDSTQLCPKSRIKCSPPLLVVITLSSITPSTASTQRSYGTNRKSNSRPLPVWHSWPELPSC